MYLSFFVMDLLSLHRGNHLPAVHFMVLSDLLGGQRLKILRPDAHHQEGAANHIVGLMIFVVQKAVVG